MRKATSYLILLLLGATCFSLATVLQPSALEWSQRGQDSVLKVVLGDGRRIFANHFFTKADIYFHSGYYPSIFDQTGAPKESHMSGHEDHEESGQTASGGHEGHEDHEKEPDFLGKPKDWIERVGRHFMVTEHTHLEHGQEREILPWLKVSAELDPQRVDTYTVAAYWLAHQLGKPREAAQFLREGLRANPTSYDILFSLGRLYYENDNDPRRARNVWELALRRWLEQEPGKKAPNNFALEEITLNLGRLEEKEGNFPRAVQLLEQAKAVSPAPETLDRQIEELKAKTTTRTPGAATQAATPKG